RRSPYRCARRAGRRVGTSARRRSTSPRGQSGLPPVLHDPLSERAVGRPGWHVVGDAVDGEHLEHLPPPADVQVADGVGVLAAGLAVPLAEPAGPGVALAGREGLVGVELGGFGLDLLGQLHQLDLLLGDLVLDGLERKAELLEFAEEGAAQPVALGWVADPGAHEAGLDERDLLARLVVGVGVGLDPNRGITHSGILCRIHRWRRYP